MYTVKLVLVLRLNNSPFINLLPKDRRETDAVESPTSGQTIAAKIA